MLKQISRYKTKRGLVHKSIQRAVIHCQEVLDLMAIYKDADIVATKLGVTRGRVDQLLDAADKYKKAKLM